MCFIVSSVNLKTHQFNFNIKLPHLVLDGKYIIDGRVLLIPIRGRGKLTGDICKWTAKDLIIALKHNLIFTLLLLLRMLRTKDNLQLGEDRRCILVITSVPPWISLHMLQKGFCVFKSESKCYLPVYCHCCEWEATINGFFPFNGSIFSFPCTLDGYILIYQYKPLRGEMSGKFIRVLVLVSHRVVNWVHCCLFIY